MALPDGVLTSAIDFGAYLGGDGTPTYIAAAGRLTPVHPETFRPIDLLHVESGDVITSSGIFFEIEVGSTLSPLIVRSGTGAFAPDDFLWSMQFAGWGDSPPNRVFALPADSDDVVDYDRFAPAELRPQVLVPVVTSVAAVAAAEQAAEDAAASAASIETAVATATSLAAAAQEAADDATTLVAAAQAAAQLAADAAAGAITSAQLAAALNPLTTALGLTATSADLSTLAGRVSANETLLNAATDVMTASTIVKRSAGGTFRINAVTALTAPTAVDHLTRKDYVDALGTDLATASTIMRRDASGGTFVTAMAVSTAPSAAAHATRKDYVDNTAGTSAGTANALVRRDSSAEAAFNRVLVSTLTVDAHGSSTLTSKSYVDARGGWQVAPAAASVGGSVALTTFPFENTRLVTLSSNLTLTGTPTAPAANRAGIVRIVLKQAATGGPFTVTWPAIATLPWSQGLSAPAMPTAANAEQIIELLYTGARWVAALVWTD